MRVTANMCSSTGGGPGYPLVFTFDYGNDVRRVQPRCNDHYAYLAPGNFSATFCIDDRVPGHKICQTFAVHAT